MRKGLTVIGIMALIGAIVCALCAVMLFNSCAKSGEPVAVETRSVKPEDFSVTALFEIEGSVIYRFNDAGEYHYFLIGKGDMINVRQKRTTTVSDGKNTRTTTEQWDDAATKAQVEDER